MVRKRNRSARGIEQRRNLGGPARVIRGLRGRWRKRQTKRGCKGLKGAIKAIHCKEQKNMKSGAGCEKQRAEKEAKGQQKKQLRERGREGSIGVSGALWLGETGGEDERGANKPEKREQNKWG